MFALLLSFPLYCLQGGGFDLPEPLRAEPETAAAWITAQDSKAPAEQRLLASKLVVARVNSLAPAEQLPFFLKAKGSGLLPADLTTVFRQLDSRWDLLETRLIESLLLPLPAEESTVRGALLAAGELASSNVGLIEGVAVFLDRQNFAADARNTLENLCGRQFADRSEFQLWWQASSALGREVWLETAYQQNKAQELADWRMLFANGADIQTILRGLQHRLQEVNQLALAALKLYDFAGADAATKAAISATFRDLLLNEKVLAQRKALMELVPRFLTGHEGLNSLLRVLEFGQASEKQSAARLLKQIQPPEIAWQGVLRGLEGVYPADTEGPVGSESVRIALWGSLSFLSPNGVAPVGVSDDGGAVELRLRQALAVENSQDVRGHLYSAIGTVAGASFLPVLETLVMNVEAATAERTDALIAMTAIAQRIPEPTSLVELLPQLLADAKMKIRRQAIESLSLLNPPGTPLLLVRRLPLEGDVFLQKRILTALSGKRSAEVLEPLLAFKPAAALHHDYGSALVAQVGSDLGALSRVFTYFEEQVDSLFQIELVFRVARSFPLDGLSEQDQLTVSRKHAVAVSKYLLAFGVQNGNSVYAADAVGRLRDWVVVEPQNGLWLDYLVELQLYRGEIVEALQVLPVLLALPDYDLSRKWELGLSALRNASARQMLVEGRQVLDQLEALGEMPPEWRTYADQQRENFPALEPPAPAQEPAPPEVSTGETPAEGAPAEAPDGGSETPKMASNLPEM